MNFRLWPQRPRAESIVLMIKVGFLLLIFCLLTAQIAPTDPFKTTRPTARDGADLEWGKNLWRTKTAIIVEI